jgi:hypothetical protein
MIPEKRFIQKRFKKVFGRYADLDSPHTFNEKLQWLKLNDRTPLHTLCADKYAVRQYVAEKIGTEYLVPLLYHTENPADIRPENLPDAPFVIKTTHGSGGVMLVRDKAAINWKALRRDLRELLRANYYYESKEWPYKNIQPRIVVEKMLCTEDGNIPFDYKINCFHGKPIIIQVDLDRFTNHKRNLYDTQWRLQPFTWCKWQDGKPLWPNGRDIPAPSQLEQMLWIARTLSSEFLYARVDLYDMMGQLFFGEITFNHGSGRERFTPPEWDTKLGDMLILPKDKMAMKGDR